MSKNKSKSSFILLPKPPPYRSISNAEKEHSQKCLTVLLLLRGQWPSHHPSNRNPSPPTTILTRVKKINFHQSEQKKVERSNRLAIGIQTDIDILRWQKNVATPPAVKIKLITRHSNEVAVEAALHFGVNSNPSAVVFAGVRSTKQQHFAQR